MSRTWKFGVALRFAALILVLLPASVAVGAQETNSPGQATAPSGAASSKVLPAPVGHRQPRAADVPSNAPKDELAQRIEQINRKLDRDLQICRGC